MPQNVEPFSQDVMMQRMASQQQHGTAQLSIMTSYSPSRPPAGRHWNKLTQTFMVNARPSKEPCVSERLWLVWVQT